MGDEIWSSASNADWLKIPNLTYGENIYEIVSYARPVLNLVSGFTTNPQPWTLNRFVNL